MSLISIVLVLTHAFAVQIRIQLLLIFWLRWCGFPFNLIQFSATCCNLTAETARLGKKKSSTVLFKFMACGKHHFLKKREREKETKNNSYLLWANYRKKFMKHFKVPLNVEVTIVKHTRCLFCFCHCCNNSRHRLWFILIQLSGEWLILLLE